MKQSIPVSSSPNQLLTCYIGGAACSIQLRQLSTGLYLSINVNNGALILNNRLCLDRVDVLSKWNKVLAGKLYIEDTQGITDPHYAGLGTRYRLIYES